MVEALYDQLDATGMAELVRGGRVAPDAFVREAQRRIRGRNPAINAVVHEFPPQYPPGGGRDGAFAGVPLLVKDIGMAVRDTPVTSGSALMRGTICAGDNTLAARYRAAGFVFLGRTTTAEFALAFTAEPEFQGPCRNPWDLTRTAGGSSGGAAAAVAAGIVPVAQSSDGAGSTRVPAAHCGLFGFKPSRMRNPVGPALAEGSAGMSTPHAISRSVRDSARMLDVSAGPDIGDPYAVPAQDGSFAAIMEIAPKPLRIGLLLDSRFGRPDADCIAAAREAGALCAALGHHVEPAAPDYDQEALKQAWFDVSAVTVAQWIDGHVARQALQRPEDFIEPVNLAWIEAGRRISGSRYLDAVQELHRSGRAMGRFFQTHDILLSPTTAEVAPPLGELAGRGRDLHGFFDRFWRHSPFTAVFNASGCPAMSVPLYWTAAGLPVGVQFGAAFGADALLLQLARQLEIARPWAGRRPEAFRSATK